MFNLDISQNTSKDSLTKTSKVRKDSRTTFWGFTVCNLKSESIKWNNLKIENCVASTILFQSSWSSSNIKCQWGGSFDKVSYQMTKNYWCHIIFHFWGCLIFYDSDYNIFATILNTVPEECWWCAANGKLPVNERFSLVSSVSALALWITRMLNVNWKKKKAHYRLWIFDSKRKKNWVS